MRFDGTLTTWNDDKGFGFIAPTGGGDDIFVHISAFSRDAPRPRLGEPLSFEIDLNHQSKKRAVNVYRPSVVVPVVSRRAMRRPPRSKRSPLGSALAVVLVLCIAGYGYTHYERFIVAPPQAQTGNSPVRVGAVDPNPQQPKSSCDGRTHCSQMTSCAEATFFLKNCPGVEMDGNNDGVPCEQQWCTSPFAK